MPRKKSKRPPMQVLTMKVPRALLRRLDAMVAKANETGEYVSRGSVIRAAMVAHLKSNGF